MQQPLRSIAIGFAAILLVCTGFVERAHALTVSPARLEIDGNPGSQLKVDMILSNDKDEDQTLYSSYANFEAQGETGTPSFVEGTTDLATWMLVPQTLTLAPFETKTIPLVINIPQSADPGGHFAAVFWSNQPPHTSNDGQVAIGAKLGILVLLRVNGNIPEAGSILSFDTRDGVHRFNALPVTFNYRFNNDGGDRVKPVGNIVIRNILGIKSTVVDGNPNQGNVLPHSIRRFETSWTKGNTATQPQDQVKRGFWESVGYQWHNFAFGRYTATLALSYTSKNITSSATTHFWVFPWQLLLVILVILLIVYFGFKKMLRSYNRMLIAQVREKIEEEIEEKLEEQHEERQEERREDRQRERNSDEERTTDIRVHRPKHRKRS